MNILSWALQVPAALHGQPRLTILAAIILSDALGLLMAFFAYGRK
jgi:hypothetical protein